MINCLIFSSIYSSSGCHFWLQSSPFWRTLWRSSWQIVCWFSQCCHICSSLMCIFLRMLPRRSSGNISAFSIRKTHNNTNTKENFTTKIRKFFIKKAWISQKLTAVEKHFRGWRCFKTVTANERFWLVQNQCRPHYSSYFAENTLFSTL